MFVVVSVCALSFCMGHFFVFVCTCVDASICFCDGHCQSTCACIIFIFLCLLNSVRSQLDLTLEATMARDSCVFQAIKKYGVAGYPLAANEERDVGRFCEVGMEIGFRSTPLTDTIQSCWHGCTMLV